MKKFIFGLIILFGFQANINAQLLTAAGSIEGIGNGTSFKMSDLKAQGSVFFSEDWLSGKNYDEAKRSV